MEVVTCEYKEEEDQCVAKVRLAFFVEMFTWFFIQSTPDMKLLLFTL
jgi:hypothetical protein